MPRRCAQGLYGAWNWAIDGQKSDELSHLWFFYRFFQRRLTLLGISLI